MSVYERVRRVASETFDVPEAEITPQSRLKDLSDLDSMEHIEFAMALEEEFHLDVSDEEAEEWDKTEFATIQDVADWVTRHLP